MFLFYKNVLYSKIRWQQKLYFCVDFVNKKILQIIVQGHRKGRTKTTGLLRCFLSINNHNFLVVWIYVHRFWDGINMVHNGAFPWESLGDLSRCQDQADAHQDVLHQSHHRDHVAYCYFPGMFAFVGS